MWFVFMEGLSLTKGQDKATYQGLSPMRKRKTLGRCKGANHTVQKLPADCGLTCPTESKKSEANHLASKLMPATAGSAGLDLAARESVTLRSSSVHLVPTGV